MTVIDPERVKRVKAAKAKRQASARQYLDWSRIAFIVHSFNRAANIDQLVSGLRRVRDHELDRVTMAPSTVPGNSGWRTCPAERFPGSLE